MRREGSLVRASGRLDGEDLIDGGCADHRQEVAGCVEVAVVKRRLLMRSRQKCLHGESQMTTAKKKEAKEMSMSRRVFGNAPHIHGRVSYLEPASEQEFPFKWGSSDQNGDQITQQRNFLRDVRGHREEKSAAIKKKTYTSTGSRIRRYCVCYPPLVDTGAARVRGDIPVWLGYLWDVSRRNEVWHSGTPR